MGRLFSIGQKVVANRDHSDGHFKKGEEFTVFDTDIMCEGYVIKIHESSQMTIMTCKHGQPWPFNGRYYLEKCFDPIQEVGEMTFEEAFDMVQPKEKLTPDKIKEQFKKEKTL